MTLNFQKAIFLNKSSSNRRTEIFWNVNINFFITFTDILKGWKDNHPPLRKMRKQAVTFFNPLPPSDSETEKFF